MALRMSGHLLLGLAKIYQLQVNFLYVECNSVISKIKQVSWRLSVPRAVQAGVVPAALALTARPPGPLLGLCGKTGYPSRQ